MMPRFSSFLTVFLIFTFLCLTPATPDAREIDTWDLWTSSPWVASIARYVGGIYVNVQSLRTWDETGKEIETTGMPPKETPILAIAPGDLYRKGYDPRGRAIRYLYSRAPVSTSRMDQLFLDPAALPFIAQRVMIGISHFDPEHYSYFQRRLAEFQSRLESTIDVGRQIIGNTKLLDLTWRSSQLIEAAVDSPVRPPDATRLRWEKGEDLGLLNLTVKEAAKRNWVIVTDAWTPQNVLALIPGGAKRVHVPPPREDQELFFFLYDQYLSIWNSVRE